ncbi:MAG TPA: methyltransferase domain-containing protein [Saprospiraceae bacterium]|nr:methyltransferase domain-containing protein [Saprospiraceae bacterium]
MKNYYVQYGCGLSAPKEWINFDVSPTLRIQRIPLLGTIIRRYSNTKFPLNVRYGDIIKGLPVADNSCDGVYCSHTLEHLSLNDFRTALRNTFRILRKGGIFRCVVPDLEYYARHYIELVDAGDAAASIDFMRNTYLGSETRRRDITGLLIQHYGNAKHLWMWDRISFEMELKSVGFVDIRKCHFNDCSDSMFNAVEDSGRFENAVSFESRK